MAEGDGDNGPGQHAPIDTTLAVDPNQTPAENNNISAQPQVLGGFVVDNEEDDSEEYTPTYHPSIPQTLDGALGEERDASQPAAKATDEPADSIFPTTHDSVSNTEQKQSNSDPITTDQSPIQSAPIDSPAVSAATPSAVPHKPSDNVTSDVDSKSKPLHNPNAQQPSQAATMAGNNSTSTTALKTRLPNDRVGILEDRIKEDPLGDIEAWLSLIDEYRKRDKRPEARAVFERFFKVFPNAAEQWVACANMELENNDFYQVEQIFNKSLLNNPNLQLWITYLNYVRRRNNLNTDTSGNARKVVTETYEFVLRNVGLDKDSGSLWQEYVQFLRSGPDQVGGTTWQDQQKTDTLRKVYQRAVCIPTQSVVALWKEYEAFEMANNKQTGRKFLQEISAAHMTARGSYTSLQNLVQGLNRTTLPRLPPIPGFQGDVEYMAQINLWKQWTAWEKDDPLVLKDEDVAAYHARILFVYRQALMALRFWPEIWLDAAEFCYEKGLEKEGNEFLTQGISANPQSCLLAFKQADRIESSSNKEGQDNPAQRGTAVREPFNKLLDALYELCSNIKQRESQELARIDETFGIDKHLANRQADDDDDDTTKEKTEKDSPKAARTEACKQSFRAQLDVLTKTISSVWIALMRTIRRVQGKGTPGDAVGGLRQTFADARKRGRITSDVYIASALLEHYCYRDPAANRIFERGMKLYQEDECLPLAYIKYLISTNDVTNARAVFETTVSKLSQNPKLIHKTKPLFKYLHEFECQYGELSQIKKLESRMKEMFPEDTQLQSFSNRFAEPDFDPTSVQLIISPAAQTKPKVPGPPNVVNTSSQNSPARPVAAATSPRPMHSPKRPRHEAETEAYSPRKQGRSDSPLKGAAGRRLDAQKRSQLRNQQAANGSHSTTPSMNSYPPPIPSAVHTMLSIIPRPDLFGPNITQFNAQRVADLVRNVDLARARLVRTTPQMPPSQMPPSQMPPSQMPPQMPPSQVPPSQLPPPPGSQNWTPSNVYGYQHQNPNYGYGR